MPKKCNMFNCRGNYPGEEYSPVVKFPSDAQERERWILSCPTDHERLRSLTEIYACRSHFTKFVTFRGGTRPEGPPTVFPGVPQSCCNQTISQPRPTKVTSAEAREERERLNNEEKDKIGSFADFVKNLKQRFKNMRIIHLNNDLTISVTDTLGREVVQFLHFKHVESSFGFLFLEAVEKYGYRVPKKLFNLQKNSLISRWSQIDQIISITRGFEPTNDDYMDRITKLLDTMVELHDNPHFQFIQDQVLLLLTKPNGRRFTKHSLILATELFCVSPAAYRMLRNSGAICLPHGNRIRELLSYASDDTNLEKLFAELKPEQRLVNLLFDEVKLVSAVRFTGGHMMGYATNDPDSPNTLATSALVFEIICHHGGPRYIFRVHPTHKLNAPQLLVMMMEAVASITAKGGTVISLISDNCGTNRGVYKLMGGPGKVTALRNEQSYVLFLVYDYVHIFKNIRNNWYTETCKELSFTKNDKTYLACWNDIVALYKEDSKSDVRLTKLTHTSVFPKPLQRQSVPLVTQVFNDKTIAAFKALKNKVPHNEGTVIFIQMIVDWFKMCNVKDKYAAIRNRDDLRSPWTPNCTAFTKLNEIAEVISTCMSSGRHRVKSLTNYTADALKDTTKFNMEAAKYLFENYPKFQYILPAIFSQDPLEKFFGQARQRCGGNFYIDIVDVLAVMRMQIAHQLLTYDLLPDPCATSKCPSCTENPHPDDVDVICSLSLTDTQELVQSDRELKHKAIYIAGYITNQTKIEHDSEESVSCEFLDELNRGGLTLPTMATVFFVQCGMHAQNSITSPRLRCRIYFTKLLQLIHAPIAEHVIACRTLANIIMKAFVTANSDREQTQGCLRRKEKLASKT